MITVKRWLMLGVALAACGCGTPGPPLPPSLNLPDPVTDLAAVRAGNQVALSWTMPLRNTDKLILKGKVAVRVCRAVPPAPCTAVANLSVAPGTNASYTDRLPADLAAGEARPLTYTVELRNARGRSAGVSNAAEVLAGTAPDAVTELSAEVRKHGVVLHWRTEPGAKSGEDAIRLHRTLLSAPPSREHAGPLAPAPEAKEQSLLVAQDAGEAIDHSARFDRTYEYRAQRVTRVTIAGRTLDLAGPESQPVRVDVRDVFPPTTPRGLEAVANPAGAGVGASVDLNWQPVTDEDLAGYVVYRHEAEAAWTRISGPQPLVAPAFHDADVQPGHTYRYAVSAVDRLGHESTRSNEAEETVPSE